MAVRLNQKQRIQLLDELRKSVKEYVSQNLTHQQMADAVSASLGFPVTSSHVESTCRDANIKLDTTHGTPVSQAHKRITELAERVDNLEKRIEDTVVEQMCELSRLMGRIEKVEVNNV